MIKSPLRYPGGKSRGVDFLKNFLPDYDEMREVFFGGGSFLFHCLQNQRNKSYKASDLNYELYSFWSQLKDNSKELIDGIQKIYDEYKNLSPGIDTYENGKKLFTLLVSRRDTNVSELERGIDFFVLNRITFSGVVDSGGYSQGSFDGRFTQTSIDRLRQIVPLLKDVDFFCENYSYLVEKEGENVFLFLDPPYYSATKSKLYGRNGILHTNFDHVLLFETLKKSNHKWLITYDNSDYVRELYKGYYQKEWKLQYGMTNRNNSSSRLGNELLIGNYDLEMVYKTNNEKNDYKQVKTS